MVHLEDFDVEFVAESGSRTARQRGKKIDAQTHVARANDRRVARGGVKTVEIVLRKSGGADHGGDARLGCKRGKFDGRGGRRKVDDRVSAADKRQRIGPDCEASRETARERPRIVADPGGVHPFKGACECEPIPLNNRPHNHTAHAAGRAGDDDAQFRQHALLKRV